jgi:hypothetical protein
LKIQSFIAILTLFTLGSCASKSPRKDNVDATPARKSLLSRVTEDSGYKQDSQGNWVAKDNRRSPYESKGQSPYFQKDFKKQEYKAGDYAKKSWWGNKEIDRQSYAGNTKASAYQKTSALQGKSPREAQNVINTPGSYDTNSYGTSSARETATAGIGKPSNDRIENQRESFDPPEIINWRQQRSLSVDQSRGILGR